MPKEGSVAPQERINLVYKPATGGQPEQKELPLKLLVMGDFTLRPEDTLVEDRHTIKVDKHTFNDVMKEQGLSLSIEVENKLSGQGRLPVELHFNSDQDFEPDAIAQQVPSLRDLVELRKALLWLKGPLGNKREFRRRLEACVKNAEDRDRLCRELGIENTGS